jgi:hypothetical protein
VKLIRATLCEKQIMQCQSLKEIKVVKLIQETQVVAKNHFGSNSVNHVFETAVNKTCKATGIAYVRLNHY